MFYYEQMFNTALSGIMSAGLMSTILTVAYGVLLASLLFSAYRRGREVVMFGLWALPARNIWLLARCL